jgi:hypothetical protein
LAWTRPLPPIVGVSLLGGALVIGSLADAQPTPARAAAGGNLPGGTGFHCGKVSRTLDYLFWPKGHAPGTPSSVPGDSYWGSEYAGPRFDPGKPYLSVYRPGSDHPDSAWLMLTAAPGVIAAPALSHNAQPCPVTPFSSIPPEIGHQKATTRAVALRCKFRNKNGYVSPFENGSFDAPRGPIELRVVQLESRPRGPKGGGSKATRLILRAKLSGTRPKLWYDSSFCKPVALRR